MRHSHRRIVQSRDTAPALSQACPAEYSQMPAHALTFYMRTGVALLSALALLSLAACGDKQSADTALGRDSALGRDLAMAASDSNAQPKLQDVAVAPPPAPVDVAPTPRPTSAPTPTPKPRTPTPKPTPATGTAPAAPAAAPKPSAPTTGSIDAGTTLSFTNSAKVCSNTSKVGDKFTAELTQAVSGSNGVMLPAGATGTFEVTEARTAKNSNDTTYLRVRMLSVTYDGNSYPVEATVQSATTERVRSATKGTDAKKVAGGAIVGAIAGRIIGKGAKGTVIGAAAGAAAGTAAASATADFDMCMNGGASIAVKLDSPVTVRIGSGN
jgi:hypothetical protein